MECRRGPDQLGADRDLRAIKEFPEYDMYWHIPAIRFGAKTTQNYNKLIGRYPGADGMKTGFIAPRGSTSLPQRRAKAGN